MKFDQTQTVVQPDGLKVEYGIINGNSKVIIIKAGAGGSYMGHEDKYLKMAAMLHEANGCSVICLSNYEMDSFERADLGVIRDFLARIDGEIELSYIGNSNGATQGLLTATKYFEFRRMVLINMPLMLNFHKIKEALTRVKSEIRFVYGEKDPSYGYIPYLQNACQQEACVACAHVETVHGADHNFADMLDIFLDLGRFTVR